MEIEVLKEDSKGFEVMISGEDHTFLNLLTSFLGERKEVKYSAYKIEHPLVGEPKLFFSLKNIKDTEEVGIRSIKGLGPKTADKLESLGIFNLSQLVLKNPETLSEQTGISEKQLSKYIKAAKKVVPKDKFGYRGVLKETLVEVSKSIEKLKKGL